MKFDVALIRECESLSKSRPEFWSRLANSLKVEIMAEIGVYRGEFAADMLRLMPDLKKYYLLDPWRHLDDWNKPSNKDNERFEQFYQESVEKTAFAANKRVFLRGKTTEVIDQIPDNELDFAYVDGDHTLKGIAIDLIRVFPKVREGGWIGGDDFSASIWQHSGRFEPTLVFPFAVYFAEAMQLPIVALRGDQFIMQKSKGGAYQFIDSTGKYRDTGLRKQLTMWRSLPVLKTLHRKLTRG